MDRSKFFINLKSLAKIALTASIFATPLLLEGNGPNKALATPSMMEFRWEGNDNYKKLYYFQSSNIKRDRSTYYLVLKPKHRKFAILKLNISFPDYFDATLKAKKFYLCRVQLGGMLERTKCLEKLPAVFEVAEDQSSVDVFPQKPIPVDKEGYAVVMKIFNPNQAGMYQLNATAQSPGDLPISSYIGSWNFTID